MDNQAAKSEHLPIEMQLPAYLQTTPATTQPLEEPVGQSPTSLGDIPAQRTRLPLEKELGAGQGIGLDDFNFLTVLGKGNLGKVVLAELKNSKKLYAVRELKKELVIGNDEAKHVRSERRVFMMVNRENHPFLTNLHSCFQTETCLYFVMEYISGGSLAFHLNQAQFGMKRSL